MTYEYKTKGTCSRNIVLEMDGDTIQSACFEGGCNGNLKGICSLIQGRDAGDIIEMLEGTTCGDKTTSCPDQLSKALKSYLDARESAAE